jgi:hypothetical protein
MSAGMLLIGHKVASSFLFLTGHESGGSTSEVHGFFIHGFPQIQTFSKYLPRGSGVTHFT